MSGTQSHEAVTRKTSSVFGDRTRSTLDPLVSNELIGKTLPTPNANFLQHVLGAPPALLAERQRFLLGLAENIEIQNSLRKLCELYDARAPETQRYEPFADLANLIIDKTRKAFPSHHLLDMQFVRIGPKVVKGSKDAATLRRKPDVALVCKDVAQIKWTDILLSVKFKIGRPSEPGQERQSQQSSLDAPSGSKLTQRKKHDLVDAAPSGSKRKWESSIADPDSPSKKSRRQSGSGSTGESQLSCKDFLQLSSYAAEVLSSTNGTRTHALGLFVDAEDIQLWYYDRAGAIHTETRINLRDDFGSFATVIIALSGLSLTQFGILDTVTFPPSLQPPDSLDNAVLKLSSTQYSITLTSDVISFRPGIVGRNSFVCGAWCSSIDDDIVVKFSFQDVARTNEFDTITFARGCGVEHLPTVYLSQDFVRLSEGPRGEMIAKSEDGTLQYTDRVLRIMVAKRYTPVYKTMQGLDVFRGVIRDIAECINQLRTKADILHRDISCTNLMAEKWQDGSFHGILNDFDLAVRVSKLRELTSPCRTGTLPFLALELLIMENPTHCFRYDLESLFYVLVWISAHYDEKGTDVQPEALRLWQIGPHWYIGAMKQGYVLWPTLPHSEASPTPFYKPMREGWLLDLHFEIQKWHIRRLKKEAPVSDEVEKPMTDGDLTDDALYEAFSKFLA